MTAQLIGLIVAAVASAAVGVFALILRNAKKAGQKQAEADLEKRNAEAAKEAGVVVAEHRTPRDLDKRLRDGTF